MKLHLPPRFTAVRVAEEMITNLRQKVRQCAEWVRVWAAIEHVEVHKGATERWSPMAALAAAEAYREPEERLAEAADREAVELKRHWEKEERDAAEAVADEMDALGPVLSPLFAAVDEACRAALEGMGVTEDEFDALVAAYRSAGTLTREWPAVRDEEMALV